MNTTESGTTDKLNSPNVLSSYECFLIAFVLGAVAATFAKCVSAPFERVKLFQQCLYAQYSETKVWIPNPRAIICPSYLRDNVFITSIVTEWSTNRIPKINRWNSPVHLQNSRLFFILERKLSKLSAICPKVCSWYGSETGITKLVQQLDRCWRKPRTQISFEMAFRFNCRCNINCCMLPTWFR